MVIAFAGRDRAIDSANRSRLWSMFESTGITLLGVGMIEVLIASGFTVNNVFKVVSILIFLSAVFQLYRVLRAGSRLVRDPEAVTTQWIVIGSSTIVIVVGCLCLINLFIGGQAWPLIAAFYLHLGHAVWAFYRILTLPN